MCMCVWVLDSIWCMVYITVEELPSIYKGLRMMLVDFFTLSSQPHLDEIHTYSHKTLNSFL